MTEPAIQMIPASKLRVSSENVRKESASKKAEMKSSIRERGLLQNLIAVPTKKPRGTFEVIAGGVRLSAIHELIQEKVFADDYLVPCLIFTNPDSKSEISLQENYTRSGMNPADECRAFKHIIEADGIDITTLAKRFGVTSRFVASRLRLADLAEPVLDALSNGIITLDTAQAFAVRPDHDLQEAVFATMTANRDSFDAERVRTAMTSTTVFSNSPAALFVGREAYLAAGGRVTPDLFSTDDNEIWEDPAILQKLFAAKLQTEEERLTAETGAKCVKLFPTDYIPWSATRDLVVMPTTLREATDEEQIAIDQLQAEIEALQQTDADDPSSAASHHIEEKEAQLNQIQRSRCVASTEEERSNTVYTATIDRQGEVRLNPVPYRERETAVDSAHALPSNGNSEEPATSKSHSAALLSDLARDRTDILRLYLVYNPAVAIDLLAFLLADSAQNSGFSISPPDGAGVHVASTNIPAFADQGQQLNTSWRSKDTHAERFDAFSQLTPDERALWLAHTVANSALASADGPSPLQRHLADVLQIDTTLNWRPTESNYWSRVPQQRVYEALEDVGGTELRERFAGLKKGALAQVSEQIFTGNSSTVEPHILERAAKWQPTPITFGNEIPHNNPVLDDGDPDTRNIAA